MDDKNLNCEDCFMKSFCKGKASDKILKECQSLDIEDRILFANENKLVNIEETFTEIFWDFQDFKRLLIPIEIIKRTYEDPENMLPSINPELVKEEMFKEIIIKFCKLAEDLGGLIYSRDVDLFKFAQKFNQFGVGNVVSFYDTVPLSDDTIYEIFNYPKIESQTSKQAIYALGDSLKCLKFYLNDIKDNYNEFRQLYNSYKHGYRIRLLPGPHSISDPKSKTSEIYEAALLFYVSKNLRKNPFKINMIYFKKFNEFVFEGMYDLCLAIIYIIEAFLNNFNVSLSTSDPKNIILFYAPDLIEMYRELYKDVEFIFK